MVEFYKEVARYQATIQHQRTGDIVDFKAVVLEGPSDGRFHIQYSHTCRAENAIGFRYSDSMTGAQSAEEAEVKVRSWAETIEKSFEVGPWNEDI